jgi:RHS repeat-associated protein
VGSGSVVDQVAYTYDGWGNVSAFEQDRNGTVAPSGDQYAWGQAWAKNTSGRNAVRISALSLASGARTETWDLVYGTAGGRFDNDASRVTQVKSGATALAQYDYNGLGTVVGTDYAEPDVMSMRYTSTPGDLPDLDRFNRPIKSKWTKDLATDRSFYDIDIAWDRNSNITRIEDNVHAGFAALYTIDNLNRLSDTQEGTWNGSSITSETRQQTWTLSHTGNWDNEKLDLNGDGDWADTDEHNDTRTHNAVNELTAQDTDTSGGNDRTLTYDEAGNMTYDGVLYTYKWDAFYRLREVRLQSNSALVAEYKYNGLGYRISRHSDTDSDSDVDGNDKWFHTAYDPRWRMVATFRESDSDPKETFVNHQAGLDGRGGSSYIDLVICRNKDANTAWTTASDGTLEERVYYCQNYHADVSTLVSSSGTMIEWDKYLAYGTPFGLPGGDADSDGDCDAADVTQIDTWIAAPAYDVRGDIDLDGDVDATDKATVVASYQGTTLGRGVLTQNRIRNRKGNAGYEYMPEIGDKYLVRNRVHAAELGRWVQRDPSGYRDGPNLLKYGRSMPLLYVDPTGEISIIQNAEAPPMEWWEPKPKTLPYDMNECEARMWKKMPLGEKSGWVDAYACAKKADFYNSMADWSAGPFTDATGGNAILHCTLACQMTKNLGTELAKKLLDMHEDCEPKSWGATPQGHKADKHNNAQGAHCSYVPSDSILDTECDACYHCCTMKYAQGKLLPGVN